MFACLLLLSLALQLLWDAQWMQAFCVGEAAMLVAAKRPCI